MKVGILTFHNADNYGAVLQAYALTTWLRRRQIEAEIIDYRSKVFDKYKLFRTHQYKNAPYMLGVDLIKFPKKLKRNRSFSAFREKNLPITQECYFHESEMEALNEKYDYFICGSDQIWNPNLTKGVDPVYFLSFVDDPAKKIAYAPSVALKKLNEFQTEKMVSCMKTFSSLSIREQEAIDLLQPYCEKEITKTCDPVFLPDPSCYDSICSEKYDGKKLAFLYVVGRAADYGNVISYAEKKAKEQGLELYYLIDGDKALYHISGKNVFGCSPNDFLSLIKNAEMIVSNSFHATAFSILFSKQFVTFLKDGTGSRMVNLLKSFRLEDRIYKAEGSEDLFSHKIDYSGIEEKLKSFKEGSERYLIRALGLNEEDDIQKKDDELRSERRRAYEELLSFTEERRKAYLVRNLDEQVVSQSRSGGVFTALSDIVLEQGGTVYGCGMEGTDTAVHQRATSREERDRFRGSKYIQSEMRDCYKQVRADLKNGLFVLFSGTACQVAGLYGFLQKEDISRLYTLDIVCHGVPSPKVWNAYLSWMKGKHGGEIQAINFRDKRYGWKAHLETVNIGGKIYSTSAYRSLFLRNAFLRPSCYECPFSSLRRKSDITIGDAWGIEKTSSPLNDDKGCSIVLINSEQGKTLFEQSASRLTAEKVDLENYLQPNLYQPSSRPRNRQRYWDVLEDSGFGALAAKYGKAGPLRRIRDRKLIVMTRLKESATARRIN